MPTVTGGKREEVTRLWTMVVTEVRGASLEQDKAGGQGSQKVGLQVQRPCGRVGGTINRRDERSVCSGCRNPGGT